MLAAILVAAILLRVVALDAYGLWNDEALTIVLSNWSIPDMFLLPTDPTPPLYYVLHKLLIPANAPVEVVRSISVAAGVMSIGLIYLLGRLAFGAAGGLLAAALLAVWTVHVDYSQEARAYSLLFFLTLLTSLGLLYYARALQRTAAPGRSDVRRRRVALVLFGVGNVLSFYTHIIATVWIILSSLLLLAIVVREQRIHRAELLSVFGVMAVCASPGIYRLIQQMLAGDEFHWLPQADLADFATTTASVFLPVGLWDNPLTDGLGNGPRRPRGGRSRFRRTARHRLVVRPAKASQASARAVHRPLAHPRLSGSAHTHMDVWVRGTAAFHGQGHPFFGPGDDSADHCGLLRASETDLRRARPSLLSFSMALRPCSSAS